MEPLKLALGPRARISPEQIPSPVEVAEADEETWEGKNFTTLPGGHVPLSTTDFMSIDQGAQYPIAMSSVKLTQVCREFQSEIH